MGSNAHGYRVDVTLADDRRRLFADLARDFGKMDIVFANAGISGKTPTGETNETAFENIVHVNLSGAFFTVNSAAPLLNDNASTIFDGSAHNYLGQAGVAAYAAIKGGMSRWHVRLPRTWRRVISASMSSHRERPKPHLEARVSRFYVR